MTAIQAHHRGNERRAALSVLITAFVAASLWAKRRLAPFRGHFVHEESKRESPMSHLHRNVVHFMMYLRQRGTERFHPGLQPRNQPPLARRCRVTTVRYRGEVGPDVGGDLGEIRTLPA